MVPRKLQRFSLQDLLLNFFYGNILMSSKKSNKIFLGIQNFIKILKIEFETMAPRTGSSLLVSCKLPVLRIIFTLQVINKIYLSQILVGIIYILQITR